jgi:hypothetical protein
MYLLSKKAGSAKTISTGNIAPIPSKSKKETIDVTNNKIKNCLF